MIAISPKKAECTRTPVDNQLLRKLELINGTNYVPAMVEISLEITAELKSNSINAVRVNGLSPELSDCFSRVLRNNAIDVEVTHEN